MQHIYLMKKLKLPRAKARIIQNGKRTPTGRPRKDFEGDQDLLRLSRQKTSEAWLQSAVRLAKVDLDFEQDIFPGIVADCHGGEDHDGLSVAWLELGGEDGQFIACWASG